MPAVPNPYDPLHPTDNPAYFYGRDEVFAFFRQNLVGVPHDRALVLSGRRGLGKSSVLRQLGFQLDDRYQPAIVRMEATDHRSEATLLAALVDEVHLAMERAEVSTYRLPFWPEPDEDEDPVDLRAWFRDEFLEVAMTALRQRYLLLAFDDAHLLLQAIENGDLPDDFLAYLQDVVTQYERLDIVFAIDDAFEESVISLDLCSDPALHIRLADLTADEAEQLVREPMQGIVEYQPDVVARILSLTGGHPFLVHSICRLLFRRSDERGHHGQIADLDVTAVFHATLEQSGEILNPLWSRASSNEHITLAAMVALDEADQDTQTDIPQPDSAGPGITFDAIFDWLTRAGYEINKTQLASALRSLDYAGLIHTQPDGTYDFPAALIPAWIAANTPPTATPPAAKIANRARWAAAVGVIVVILAAGGLGAAVWGGVFDDNEDDSPVQIDRPTATLSLNLEATRQSEFATQTEAARPTETATKTETPTATPTETPTASRTPRPSATPAPTDTAAPTNTPSRTPRPTRTDTPEASDTPTDTPSDEPTETPTGTPTTSRTPRPTRTPLPSATPAPSDTPTASPSDTPEPSPTRTLPPTNTPRPTRAPTLEPN